MFDKKIILATIATILIPIHANASEQNSHNPNHVHFSDPWSSSSEDEDSESQNNNNNISPATPPNSPCQRRNSDLSLPNLEQSPRSSWLPSSEDAAEAVSEDEDSESEDINTHIAADASSNSPYWGRNIDPEFPGLGEENSPNNIPASPSGSSTSSSDSFANMLSETQATIDSAHRLLQECRFDGESTPAPIAYTPYQAASSSSSTKPRQIVRIWDYRNTSRRKNTSKIIRRYLLRKSISKNIKTFRHLAVINAIKDNDPIELQRLIKEGKCPVDARWNDQSEYDGQCDDEQIRVNNLIKLHDQVGMILAARDEKIKCLQVLLNNGANPNFKDEDDNSLLYRTSYRGHDACALLLKRAGAHHVPVAHLGKKAGEIIPMAPSEYFKNHLIDAALSIAKRTEKQKGKN